MPTLSRARLDFPRANEDPRKLDSMAHVRWSVRGGARPWNELRHETHSINVRLND
jgi:hypothetical protein